MKKLTQLLLIALLAISMAFAFASCENTSDGEDAVTKMTIELVTASSDDAPVDEDALNDGETEYYTLTGYSFSEADANIVTRSADEYYYSDYYDGERKNTDSYKAEKARFAELQKVVLPSAVKVSVTESKIELTTEQLKSVDANGVIDLSNGATDAKTVYIRAIDGSALLGHSEITSLTVPSTYLAIGDSAFGGCGNLEELTIPFVGAKANALNAQKVFGYVFGTVEFNGGVSVTQNYNASGTATYFIPEDLKKVTVNSELPMYAFYNVTPVQEVVFVANTVVPEYAFYGSGLKKVTIPTTVKEIENGAFGSCASLLSVNFDELTLEYIGNSAFASCVKLGYQTKTLAVSANYIGENAFKGCTAIETLTVSGAIKTGAFSGMTALETVNLTNAELAVGAFASWSTFLTVNYDSTVTATVGTVKDAFVGGFEVANGTQKPNVKFVLA